jgi:hypothetical protein
VISRSIAFAQSLESCHGLDALRRSSSFTDRPLSKCGEEWCANACLSNPVPWTTMMGNFVFPDNHFTSLSTAYSQTRQTLLAGMRDRVSVEVKLRS